MNIKRILPLLILATSTAAQAESWYEPILNLFRPKPQVIIREVAPPKAPTSEMSIQTGDDPGVGRVMIPRPRNVEGAPIKEISSEATGISTQADNPYEGKQMSIRARNPERTSVKGAGSAAKEAGDEEYLRQLEQDYDDSLSVSTRADSQAGSQTSSPAGSQISLGSEGEEKQDLEGYPDLDKDMLELLEERKEPLVVSSRTKKLKELPDFVQDETSTRSVPVPVAAALLREEAEDYQKTIGDLRAEFEAYKAQSKDEMEAAKKSFKEEINKKDEKQIKLDEDYADLRNRTDLEIEKIQKEANMSLKKALEERDKARILLEEALDDKDKVTRETKESQAKITKLETTMSGMEEEYRKALEEKVGAEKEHSRNLEKMIESLEAQRKIDEEKAIRLSSDLEKLGEDFKSYRKMSGTLSPDEKRELEEKGMLELSDGNFMMTGETMERTIQALSECQKSEVQARE